MLDKAPLKVLYEKIQHEGWGRVANTARGEYHEYIVLLLICCFCVGGLLVLSCAIHCEELNSTLYEGRIIA